MIYNYITWNSGQLNMKTKTTLLLPDSYGARGTGSQSIYPVLLLLSYGEGDSSSWIYYSDIVSVSEKNDVIVVLPETYHGCYSDVELSDGFDEYLNRELPDILNRIIGLKIDRSNLFIAGNGKGGYMALTEALRYPGNYKKTICLSCITYGEEKDFDQILLRAKNSRELPMIDFYCGEEDPTYDVCRSLYKELYPYFCRRAAAAGMRRKDGGAEKEIR